LAIEIRDGIAWVAENNAVVRKIDLEVCVATRSSALKKMKFCKTGKSLSTFKGHTGPVTSLTFCDRQVGSGDKEILISGAWDKVYPLHIPLLTDICITPSAVNQTLGHSRMSHLQAEKKHEAVMVSID
jgi:WD40 repeat protein